MLEYCYAANMVSFWYLFRQPQSAVLRRVSMCHVPDKHSSPASALLSPLGWRACLPLAGTACTGTGAFPPIPHLTPHHPVNFTHHRLGRACPSFMPRQFSFAIMSGPLMWSIVAMRNSVCLGPASGRFPLVLQCSK